MLGGEGRVGPASPQPSGALGRPTLGAAPSFFSIVTSVTLLGPVCPSLPPLSWLFLIRSPSPCPVDPGVMNPPGWCIPPPHTPPEHSRCSVATRGLCPQPRAPLPARPDVQLAPSPVPDTSCFLLLSSASQPHLPHCGGDTPSLRLPWLSFLAGGGRSRAEGASPPWGEGGGSEI